MHSFFKLAIIFNNNNFNKNTNKIKLKLLKQKKSYHFKIIFQKRKLKQKMF